MHIRSAKETEVQEEGGGILQAGDVVNLRLGALFVLSLTKEGLDSPTESTFSESTALTSLADSLEESAPACIIQWGRRGKELV